MVRHKVGLLLSGVLIVILASEVAKEMNLNNRLKNQITELNSKIKVMSIQQNHERIKQDLALMNDCTSQGRAEGN